MGPCPCCGQAVTSPTFDQVVAECRLSPFQSRALEAIWKGRGQPVLATRIIDALYADDYDGGPSQQKAYAAMREAMFRIREKLNGTGVEVIYDTIRRGYSIKVNDHAAAGLRTREMPLATPEQRLTGEMREAS